MFRERLRATLGDVVERDGFCFADVVPDSEEAAEAIRT
jgi:hypothetical protein